MSSWRDTEVSVVGSAPSTMTKPSTIGDILERIRNGKWQKQASAIAENYSAVFEAATADGLADPVTVAKEAVASAKKSLPGFLFSGRFARRKAEALEAHSGFLCVDLDNCASPAALRAKLAADEHIQAAFVSPTGRGIKALVRIQADASCHLATVVPARNRGAREKARD